MFLAHSANKKKGVQAQSYAAHVGGVRSLSLKAAEAAAVFSIKDRELLKEIVYRASEFHDLGKLDDENQAVLSGVNKARHLPVQHVDAGTAFLKEKDILLGALLVRSHHIGLPDWPEEENRGELFFRDNDLLTRQKVDETLGVLFKHHKSTVVDLPELTTSQNPIEGIPSIFLRIALSCLADGDHTDTAIHYGDYPVEENIIELKPKERLVALDNYVAKLSNNNDDRSLLRTELYKICRDAVINTNIVSCDSPVGTGKTTAIMAHLLAQSNKRTLRRIIVVLPFTNIITQSVKTYREALCLPGEDPNDVVAEIHHRADFQNLQSRHLTALWKAPIIVTTAVTFFETLSSNTPATLRRLHQLPGSAIFIDESHAALPAKLLPLAWDWIKGYSAEWCCYWVLASGSLNRFWQIKEFDKEPPVVPEIVPDNFRIKLADYETERIIYKYKPEPQSAKDLVDWIPTLPGPRIVILNTVQSAAVVADLYARKYGREHVEHISTALTSNDRADTLKRVISRLTHPEKNENWTLIATSCVEAGVDLSFRTGVRELCSLVSLLQTSGRVNRHGSLGGSEVWTIRLAERGLLKAHPGVKDSAQVLSSIFEMGKEISPELCTEALRREIRKIGTELEKLRKAENEMRFPLIEKDFRVIPGDTRTVVIDKELIDNLESYKHVEWQDIQNGSVQIWSYRLSALNIPEVVGRPGLYKWPFEYNNFIGYMAGVLKIEAFANFIEDACVI